MKTFWQRPKHITYDQMFFVMILPVKLFSREQRTDSGQQLLQVVLANTGLSTNPVSALVIRRVRDKIWNITASREPRSKNSAVPAERMQTWMSIRTGIIGVHEAKRSVIYSDGQQTEVICVAHTCRERRTSVITYKLQCNHNVRLSRVPTMCKANWHPLSN